MEQLTLIDIWRNHHIHSYIPNENRAVSISGSYRDCITPVQMLLSLPEMVYPGSQVQWVVPCVMVQRDGRTFGLVVAAGRMEAAAVAGEVAAEVFVMVTKTEGRGHGEGKVRKVVGSFVFQAVL